MFLKFFEGSYSSEDYDNLEDDERDVLFKYLSASERAERKSSENSKNRAKMKNVGPDGWSG
jgi:hypothetical protein